MKTTVRGDGSSLYPIRQDKKDIDTIEVTDINERYGNGNRT